MTPRSREVVPVVGAARCAGTCLALESAGRSIVRGGFGRAPAYGVRELAPAFGTAHRGKGPLEVCQPIVATQNSASKLAQSKRWRALRNRVRHTWSVGLSRR